MSLKGLWAALMRLLFPPRCMFCDSRLPSGVEEVCEQCRKKIVLSNAPSLHEKGAFYASATAAMVYEGDVRKALHRFKFQGRQTYAPAMARMMAYAVETKIDAAPEIVTHVPTNRHNLRVRGYDHARLLAEELARRRELPYVHALRKTRRTKPMFGLHPAERRANVLGAFEVCCDPARIKGKIVLLVDDILTTGSTMSECARMLRSAGAAEVYGVAFASPKHQ